MKLSIIVTVLIIIVATIAEHQHNTLLGSGMGPRGLAGVCGVHGRNYGDAR